jgi:hypothetical protein
MLALAAAATVVLGTMKTGVALCGCLPLDWSRSSGRRCWCIGGVLLGRASAGRVRHMGGTLSLTGPSTGVSRGREGHGDVGRMAVGGRRVRGVGEGWVKSK